MESVRSVFFVLSHPPLFIENDVCNPPVAREIDLQLAANFLLFAPTDELGQR